jgi:SAM-dependent methyltransferase
MSIPVLRLAWRFLQPLGEPRQVLAGLAGYRWFLGDLWHYRRLPGAEPLALADLRPMLHERTAHSTFDAHYVYLNSWAMHQIVAARPPLHVDIGSQITFVSLLAAVVPVVFLDYRPLVADLPGLSALGGDILRLPFRDHSLSSLSCLHVAEHIGLGRYGDPLNPAGTRQAAAELARVLAPGGRLYFGLPVGQPRTEFNAHRIHDPATVLAFFPGLTLTEFAVVRDDGRFQRGVDPASARGDRYACGMYAFQRPPARRAHARSTHQERGK